MTSRQNSATRGKRAPPVNKTTKKPSSAAQPKQVTLQTVRRKNDTVDTSLQSSRDVSTEMSSSTLSPHPPRLSPRSSPSGRPSPSRLIPQAMSSRPSSGRPSSGTKQMSSPRKVTPQKGFAEPCSPPTLGTSPRSNDTQPVEDTQRGNTEVENEGKQTSVSPVSPRSTEHADRHEPSEHVAPTELFMEFITAVMEDEFETAQKLCKLILIYEPNHEEALRFQSLLAEKIQLEAEMAEEETDSDSDDSDDSDDNDDSDDSDSSEAESGDDTDESQADDAKSKTVVTHEHCK